MIVGFPRPRTAPARQAGAACGAGSANASAGAQGARAARGRRVEQAAHDAFRGPRRDEVAAFRARGDRAVEEHVELFGELVRVREARLGGAVAEPLAAFREEPFDAPARGM